MVISDRSVTTSLAYQAFGRNLGLETVWNINKRAVNGIFPDLVIWINPKTEVCLKRSAGENPDKFDKENLVFWDKTVAGYRGMLSFLQTISPHTESLIIEDSEGILSIEDIHLGIKEKLYPVIQEIYSEGRIIRER